MPCADFEASAAVIRESFMTVAEEFGLTRENAASNGAFLEADKLKELSDKGIALFDVFEEGELIGFVALEDAGSGVFYLEKLAVMPGARHNGIGRRILDFAAEYVRSHCGKTISIAIIDENKVLKRWYEDYGFAGTQIKTYPHLPFTVCFMSFSV
jgi:ribosomal protein S18 acetylase RimI-like enzyme